MIASQAFCWAALKLPHISPARLNPAGGKFDQRCRCAVLLQSNSPVLFSVSFSVATNALAAATILGVAFCPVVDPAVVVAGAVAAPVVVAPAVTSVVGAALLVAAAPVSAVAAVVAAGALVARAVGCCAAGGI